MKHVKSLEILFLTAIIIIISIGMMHVKKLKLKVLVNLKFDHEKILNLNSIAIFRVGLGLCTFLNAFHLLWFELWLKKYGFITEIKQSAKFSFYPLFNFQCFILAGIFHMFCGLALMLGYRTSIVKFFCWCMNFSLTVISFSNAGHMLLILLCLISLDLPLNQKWTLDANDRIHICPILNLILFSLFFCVPTFSIFLFSTLCFIFEKQIEKIIIFYFFSKDKKQPIYSPPTIFSVLSLFVITFSLYVGACIHHKLGNKSWTGTFMASRNSLFMFNLTKPLGIFVRTLFPTIIWKILTICTLIIEMSSPFLILVGTFFNLWQLTMIAVLHICAIHASFEILMKLDVFSYVCISFVLIYLPTEFWTKIGIYSNLPLSKNNTYAVLKTYFLTQKKIFFPNLIFTDIMKKEKLQKNNSTKQIIYKSTIFKYVFKNIFYFIVFISLISGMILPPSLYLFQDFQNFFQIHSRWNMFENPHKSNKVARFAGMTENGTIVNIPQSLKLNKLIHINITEVPPPYSLYENWSKTDRIQKHWGKLEDDKKYQNIWCQYFCTLWDENVHLSNIQLKNITLIDTKAFENKIIYSKTTLVYKCS